MPPSRRFRETDPSLELESVGQEERFVINLRLPANFGHWLAKAPV